MTDTAGMTAEEVVARYDRMKHAADKLVYVNAMRVDVHGTAKIEVHTWNVDAILEATDEDLIEFGLPVDTAVLTHHLASAPSTTALGRTRHDRQETTGDSMVCDRCNMDLSIRKFPTNKAGRRERTCRACKSGHR